MMARGARDRRQRLVVMLDLRQVLPVQIRRHLHHQAGDPLVILGIGRQVPLVERLPFFADMAERAAHAEGAGEAAHRLDELGLGNVLGQDLEVGEPIRDLRLGDAGEGDQPEDGERRSPGRAAGRPEVWSRHRRGPPEAVPNPRRTV